MPAAITFPDIRAWSELHHIDLAPWEVRTLRALDVAYLNAFADRDKDTQAGAPPRTDDGELDRQAVADQARMIFGTLAKRKRN